MNLVKDQKNEVRKAILTLLKNQKEEDRLRKSTQIREKLWQDPDFVNSKTVLFYASFQGEVETSDLMRGSLDRGKQIALPIVNVQHKKIIPKFITSLEKDLENGPYNIQQPKADVTQDIDISQIDLVVVPAVAFDRKNYRLGRGAGYYDRFLSKISQGTPLIGLAFDFQILEDLPHEDHDLSVTRVVTN